MIKKRHLTKTEVTLDYISPWNIKNNQESDIQYLMSKNKLLKEVQAQKYDSSMDKIKSRSKEAEIIFIERKQHQRFERKHKTQNVEELFVNPLSKTISEFKKYIKNQCVDPTATKNLPESRNQNATATSKFYSNKSSYEDNLFEELIFVNKKQSYIKKAIINLNIDAVNLSKENHHHDRKFLAHAVSRKVSNQNLLEKEENIVNISHFKTKIGRRNRYLENMAKKEEHQNILKIEKQLKAFQTKNFPPNKHSEILANFATLQVRQSFKSLQKKQIKRYLSKSRIKSTAKQDFSEIKCKIQIRKMKLW